jgi:hypothetical protein
MGHHEACFRFATTVSLAKPARPKLGRCGCGATPFDQAQGERITVLSIHLARTVLHKVSEQGEIAKTQLLPKRFVTLGGEIYARYPLSRGWRICICNRTLNAVLSHGVFFENLLSQASDPDLKIHRDRS